MRTRVGVGGYDWRHKDDLLGTPCRGKQKIEKGIESSDEIQREVKDQHPVESESEDD